MTNHCTLAKSVPFNMGVSLVIGPNQIKKERAKKDKYLVIYLEIFNPYPDYKYHAVNEMIFPLLGDLLI